MAPRLIADRYQLFERLGTGAMGVVYRAHDSVLDRTVAVKLMAADMAHDTRLREQFLKEARAAARLNHRHVVTIHELAAVDDEIYIVMELLDGVDLAGLIAASSPLPLTAKLAIVDQVLDGLDYAHERGVVHRDIKPGNLHLSTGGVAKILDFGIARVLSAQMTATRGMMGTPAYMSPEQTLGQPVDRRADLFALGAVTYELLSGARPFQAETVGRLMALIAEQPHEPLGADVPVTVCTLVDRLLAKDPGDRPQTAAAARQELAVATEALARPDDAEPTADLAAAVVRATGTMRETMAPEYAPSVAPRPPTPVDGPVRAAEENGLTAFALEQGRALREQGDLAGAMRALRSVLEADAGNEAALSELQLVEKELSEVNTSRATGAAPPTRPVGRWLIGAAVVLASVAGLATWFATDEEPSNQAAAVAPAPLAGDGGAPSVETPPPGALIEPPAPPPDRAAPPAQFGPDDAGPAAMPPPDDRPTRALPGPTGRGGATSLVRARFEQLSRAAEREELDEAVSTELASIRSAAEALAAAGNQDEAGEIYFRGVVLLEDVVPQPAQPPSFNRPSRRGGRGGDVRIRRTIDQYVSALERQDAEALRAVRPTLSAFELGLLNAATPARIRFEGVRVEMGQDQTTATGRMIVERADVEPARQVQSVRLSLVRNGERWQITDLGRAPAGGRGR